MGTTSPRITGMLAVESLVRLLRRPAGSSATAGTPVQYVRRGGQLVIPVYRARKPCHVPEAITGTPASFTLSLATASATTSLALESSTSSLTGLEQLQPTSYFCHPIPSI